MPEMQKNKEIIKTKNKGRTLKLKKTRFTMYWSKQNR